MVPQSVTHRSDTTLEKQLILESSHHPAQQCLVRVPYDAHTRELDLGRVLHDVLVDCTFRLTQWCHTHIPTRSFTTTHSPSTSPSQVCSPSRNSSWSPSRTSQSSTSSSASTACTLLQAPLAKALTRRSESTIEPSRKSSAKWLNGVNSTKPEA